MGSAFPQAHLGVPSEGNHVSKGLCFESTTLNSCLSSYVRSLLLIRSANNAVAFSLPVLAAVLSFIAYSLSGHKLEPAVIFTSLTLFQLLRLPLMFLRE